MISRGIPFDRSHLLFCVSLGSCHSTLTPATTEYGDIRDRMDPEYVYSTEELKVLKNYGLTRSILEHPELWSSREVEMMERAFTEELSRFDMDEFMAEAMEAAAASGALMADGIFRFSKGIATLTIRSEIVSVTPIDEEQIEDTMDVFVRASPDTPEETLLVEP